MTKGAGVDMVAIDESFGSAEIDSGIDGGMRINVNVTSAQIKAVLEGMNKEVLGSRGGGIRSLIGNVGDGQVFQGSVDAVCASVFDGADVANAVFIRNGFSQALIEAVRAA